MIIRPATPADIPAITTIYAHAVTHGTASFELTPPDETEMTRRMNELIPNGFPYLAAEIDGRVAGYAYAGLYRTRPAYRFTLEDSIYVAHDRHGHGVGRALLAALLAESTARGGLERDACGARLRLRWDAAEHRLQVRTLAGHRADAARARAGQPASALILRSSSETRVSKDGAATWFETGLRPSSP